MVRTTNTQTNKTRLGIDTLEARECPAALVYDDYCGNGIPRPPIPPLYVSQIQVAVNPAVNTEVIVIGSRFPATF